MRSEETTTETTNEGNMKMRLRSTDANGTKTYHYIGENSNGVTCGMVRRIDQDGTIVEDRKMTCDDIAGHSTASKRFGY